MEEGPVYRKSYDFAIRIVKLSRHLQKEFKEYTLSKQVLRSGTAIGALVSESKYAQSRPDFISKLHVALKEANETHYWLRLLKDTGYIDSPAFESMEKDNLELRRLLTAILNTSKKTPNQNY